MSAYNEPDLVDCSSATLSSTVLWSRTFRNAPKNPKVLASPEVLFGVLEISEYHLLFAQASLPLLVS